MDLFRSADSLAFFCSPWSMVLNLHILFHLYWDEINSYSTWPFLGKLILFLSFRRLTNENCNYFRKVKKHKVKISFLIFINSSTFNSRLKFNICCCFVCRCAQCVCWTRWALCESKWCECEIIMVLRREDIKNIYITTNGNNK